MYNIRRPDAGARTMTYIRKPIFCWVGCVKKNPNTDFFFFPNVERIASLAFTLACLLLPPPAFSKWELLLIHSQKKSLPPSTVGYYRTIGLLVGFPVAMRYRGTNVEFAIT